MESKKKVKKIKELIAELKNISETEEEFVESLNEINDFIYKTNPLQEPVSNVKWIKKEKVFANDYNPNSVAPPEMKLLELSVKQDGFTQPIVAYYDEINDMYIIVDGFHRHRVGKEVEEISKRLKGFLPIVVIEKEIKERIASTIRHNRARGTHGIVSMSKIVEQLYFLGWSDKKISEQLGMDKDEVLRLKQFTGIGALFKDRKYSKAWE